MGHEVDLGLAERHISHSLNRRMLHQEHAVCAGVGIRNQGEWVEAGMDKNT